MQFTLFEKRPLFDLPTLNRRRTEWRQRPIEGYSQSASAIDNFVKECRNKKRGTTKELELEQAFNAAFFVTLLGYELFPGSDSSWTAWPKPPVAFTRLTGEPDVLLGEVIDGRFETTAVVELKNLNASLDAAQPSYANRSAVEQAFSYARKLGTCRWVIVSNMRLVRLYSIETMDAYHEIDLWSDGSDGLLPNAEAVHLLSFENLLGHRGDSSTTRLLRTAQDEQASFRDGFYSLYTDIRSDLLLEIEKWSAGRHSREEQVIAVQRLLDRLLFIFFCEDHPDRLLRNDLVKTVVEGAVRQPGTSKTKAYDALKQLFRDLDLGAHTEFWSIPRYNGELFKLHPIIDQLNLPDSLHGKRYVSHSSKNNSARSVTGAYGLHVFDFWRELDRDLLGNLFERSLGDLTALSLGGRPDARAAFGVFYTGTRLAQFAARSAIESTLAEDPEIADLLSAVAKGSSISQARLVSQLVDRLKTYRIADLACGSGVFLTAALDALLSPYRKALESIEAGQIARGMYSYRQSEVLKSAIYGSDLLPQAVELAKLALWLTAARQNEPSADLSSNFIAADALNSRTSDALLEAAGRSFDVVVGNPPWGAEIDKERASNVIQTAGLEWRDFDSWEVFLVLAISSLRDGGRFALILPDTIFSTDKARTRAWLLTLCSLEKVYSLGPDWFTNKVRMSAVFVQGKKNNPKGNIVRTLLISGGERQDAQTGRRPLEQIEEVGSTVVEQLRMAQHPQTQIQVLASNSDLDLLEQIDDNSLRLETLTTHARGDEINADGVLWHCAGCNNYTVPGVKIKGGGYASKRCGRCEATLTEKDIADLTIVSNNFSGNYKVSFIDGGALTGRYIDPIRRYIRTDLKNLSPALKSETLYQGTKILLRQAGVGIAATLIDDNSRCPQSVYIYRATDQAIREGYTNEYILGSLVSRTVNFYSMMKSGEVDPARAFSKLTHARLASLPIPRILSNDDRKRAGEITRFVREILTTHDLGGVVDYQIEQTLRSLWKISGDEGRYINGFFSLLPPGQAIGDLFPGGPPPRIAFPSPVER